ncbi:MAG: class I SAM-dependent methyltransferase [Acidobacteria bacterium]|nr:MAG: class I SAM-dependent methyltransferase [Acidobacteriota bacterium]
MKLDDYSKKFIHYHVDDISPIIVQAIQANPRLRTLADLGCGDGTILYALRKRNLLQQFETVYAVDLSEERVRNAGRIDPGIKGLVSDVCRIPQLRDGEIDLVITNQVIEHVPDDEAMIREVRRVLSPGGVAYLATVFKKWYGWYFYKNSENRWVIDPTHVREYTEDQQLTGLFDAQGFEILRSGKKLHWFPMTDFLLKRLGYRQDVYQTHPVLRACRKLRIPIFGYYNWEFVLSKRADR